MRPRSIAWMLLAAGVTTVSLTAALAQQPSPQTELREEQEAAADDPQQPSAPEIDVVDIPTDSKPSRVDPAAKKKIERALRGEDVSSAGADPVLDDVLKIIREQGSVLEGTVLESDRGAETRPAGQNLAPRAGVSADQPHRARRQARVAEMLLKTSRLLERLEPAGAPRGRLITDMRAEAARLLSE